jgi:hypothetical protein
MKRRCGVFQFIYRHNSAVARALERFEIGITNGRLRKTRNRERQLRVWPARWWEEAIEQGGQ